MVINDAEDRHLARLVVLSIRHITLDLKCSASPHNLYTVFSPI